MGLGLIWHLADIFVETCVIFQWFSEPARSFLTGAAFTYETRDGGNNGANEKSWGRLVAEKTSVQGFSLYFICVTRVVPGVRGSWCARAPPGACGSWRLL